MANTLDRETLERAAREAADARELFVVSVNYLPEDVVEVLIDGMDGVTIEDCVAVNDAVLAAVDRDEHDFELTVAGYGISEPFVLPLHYEKNLGGEVETVTADGRKLRGVLADADDSGFTIEVPTKVKREGMKRPVTEPLPTRLEYSAVKYTKNIINF